MTQQESIDGIEMTFAVNHMAYFILTKLMLDLIIDSAPARIINLSSGNYSNEFNFNNLHGKKRFDGRIRYSQSKLANLLFTFELANRLKDTGVTVNAINPGGVATNFNKNNGWIYWLKHIMAHVLSRNLKSPRNGALASIYLASSLKVDGITGNFFKNDKMFSSSELSFDKDVALELWDKSEDLIAIKS